MLYHRHISLISCLMFQFVTGWQQYADPLIIPPAPVNQPIVINFDVQYKMTMVLMDDQNHLSMVDYFPDEPSRWFVRTSNQRMPCDSKSVMTNESNLADLLQLHGLHQRVMTVNGQSPLAPIVVPYGSEVVLRVTNGLLSESISVHIHGLDKRGLWYTDGVTNVQQCPIQMASTYSYRFIADTAGTHWFHGHLMTDRGEGILGAFIVSTVDQTVLDSTGHRVLPTRQYALVLQDWTVPAAADTWYMHIWQGMKWLYGADNWQDCWSPTRIYDGTNLGGSVPIAALLINSKGWYDQKKLLDRPWTLPLETFRIAPDEKILLRVINGGVSQELMFAIEEHPLTIVAADGVAVQPMKVDMLIIFPGERYDILIEGKSALSRKSYYILLETLEYYSWDWNTRQPHYGLGRLEYETSLPEYQQPADIKHTHCTNTSICQILNCPFAQFSIQYPYRCISAGDLKSLNPIFDTEILSNQGFSSGYEEYFLNMHHDSHINGWRFALPKGMPYFYHGRENQVAKYCDPANCPPGTAVDNPGCSCFFHLNLTANNIVQLTFYNMGEMGFGSYDIRTGMMTTNNVDIPCNNGTTCNDLQWTNTNWLNGRVWGMNIMDPSSRDTIVLPVGGYVVLRFRANNLGWFYGHCHIMLHQLGGMAFALRVGTHEEMPRPPDGFPRDCGIYEQAPLDSDML